MLKNFEREDLKFSLCGLNCRLCTMKLDSHCPGCGGGEGNQGCIIARCSLQHQGIEYCFQCEDYPCNKYDNIEEYDSFITHRNQLKDMKKAQEMGLENYHCELDEKADILQYLLENYNDGRRKSFFSITINLLELNDIHSVINELKSEAVSNDMTMKEKAEIAVSLFKNVAEKKKIVLKLNKKPSKKNM